MTNKDKKRFSIKTKRALVALLFFVVTGVGLVFSVGTGTLSAFGWDRFSIICPLGTLEAMLGSHSIILRAFLCLAVVVVLIVVFGKAFCSWACPVPYIKGVFNRKRSRKERREGEHAAGAATVENGSSARALDVVLGGSTGTISESSLMAEPANSVKANTLASDVEKVNNTDKKPLPFDTRHAVLAGTLLSTAVFGFPVFCLICPVGLSFATFIVVWRFVQFNDFTWGILVFPVIIALECLVLKKWCGKICPLGALISLIARLNVFFRPKRSEEKCLRSQGTHCEACVAACPEQIDPFFGEKTTPLSECTKCKSCSDACPAHAISFAFLSDQKKDRDSSGEQCSVE